MRRPDQVQGWPGFLPAPPAGVWHFLSPSQAKATFQAHVRPPSLGCLQPPQSPFHPHLLPSQVQLALPCCAFFQGAGFREGPGRGWKTRGGQGAACHCRRRLSLPESCPEDPPLILCFWQERQPPPASQSRGWQQEVGQGRLHQAPTLLISLVRSKRQEAEGAPVALKSGVLHAGPLDSREPLRCGFS